MDDIARGTIAALFFPNSAIGNVDKHLCEVNVIGTLNLLEARRGAEACPERSRRVQRSRGAGEREVRIAK